MGNAYRAKQKLNSCTCGLKPKYILEQGRYRLVCTNCRITTYPFRERGDARRAWQRAETMTESIYGASFRKEDDKP